MFVKVIRARLVVSIRSRLVHLSNTILEILRRAYSKIKYYRQQPGVDFSFFNIFQKYEVSLLRFNVFLENLILGGSRLSFDSLWVFSFLEFKEVFLYFFKEFFDGFFRGSIGFDIF